MYIARLMRKCANIKYVYMILNYIPKRGNLLIRTHGCIRPKEMANKIILRNWGNDIIPDVKELLLKMYILSILEKASKDDAICITLSEILYFTLHFHLFILYY